MSSPKAVAETYMDGFRRSDHAQILSCLTDDVVWDLPGYKQLHGKDEFDGEIENEAFTGNPTLDVDRMIAEGETVVILGEGRGDLAAGGVFRFGFCTVLTFREDLIRLVESFIAPIGGELPAAP